MALKNTTIYFADWAHIDYKSAWDRQTDYFKQTIQQKLTNRKLDEKAQKPTPNYLFFCEHNPVYTIGKNGDEQNLKLTKMQLNSQNIAYYPINRGGDITYHGPGQITGYPIIDLENFFSDIVKYLRYIEEAVILTLSHYGLQGKRLKDLTGVWLDDGNDRNYRKICALGVHTSRWVTMHGFAFNVNTDLNYFKNINPCGITDKPATSLQHEMGKNIDVNEVKTLLRQNFAQVFGWKELELQYE